MKSHKQLKEVLYSIIAVCVIVWAIVYVQIKSTVVQDVAPPIVTSNNELTTEQRTQVVSSLKESTAQPLTKNQRDKILQELRKAVVAK